MYDVNHNINGRMSYYFCCRIQPEGLLHDDERDLLAIAKLLLHFTGAVLTL